MRKLLNGDSSLGSDGRSQSPEPRDHVVGMNPQLSGRVPSVAVHKSVFHDDQPAAGGSAAPVIFDNGIGNTTFGCSLR